MLKKPPLWTRGIQRTLIGGWNCWTKMAKAKGKKRGDILQSFLLLRFSSLSSREGDIFSSMIHNCLIHEDNLKKKKKEIRLLRRRNFTRLLVHFDWNWYILFGFWKRRYCYCQASAQQSKSSLLIVITECAMWQLNSRVESYLRDEASG